MLLNDNSDASALLILTLYGVHHGGTTPEFYEVKRASVNARIAFTVITFSASVTS